APCPDEGRVSSLQRVLRMRRRASTTAFLLALAAPAEAATPNDFVDQQASFRAIRAIEAWGYATGDPALIVAIIDGGLDLDHPDLAPNVWTDSDGTHGWNFADGNADVSDGLGRGTHLAGIIGAVGNNGIGMAGLCWRVKLMPLKVTSSEDVTEETADAGKIAAAIRFAADHGAKVIDLS